MLYPWYKKPNYEGILHTLKGEDHVNFLRTTVENRLRAEELAIMEYPPADTKERLFRETLIAQE